VDAVTSGPSRRIDDLVDAQVALRSGRRPYRIRLVRHPHVQGGAIDLRVHGDRDDAHLPESADDANGNLATIGDEDFAHRD
jgi:hypothetical protein